MRRLIPILTILVPACVAAPVPQQSIRSAAAKAVALVQASQKTWFAKQECTSCHNQILPALAFRVAREHGIAVDEAAARMDAAKSAGIYANLDRAVQYSHFIDAAMDDGFHLVGADAMGVRPNLSTAVYARFIATRQQSDGSWHSIDARPPQSNSFVTATGLSLRALQLYGHRSLAADTRQRVDRAAKWLAAQHPQNTEERTFQLLGLFWAGGPSADLKRMAKELLAAQRDDGGWNSVAGRDSDAYSTGEALVALHDAGAVPATDSRWMRGLQYLLDTQKADGSWHVGSRMVSPVQVSPPYFETGYPYGHDQFVSLMGANWAIMALAKALGLGKAAAVPPLTEANPSGVEPWMETVLFGSEGDVKKLLDGNFDPNSATSDGTTALMMAMPDAAKAKLLMSRGANVNARSKTRYSALLVAAQYPDSMPATRLLLDKGAEAQLPKGAGKPLFNASGLTLATLSGNTEAIQLYASRGDKFDDPYLFIGMFPGPAAGTPVFSSDTRTATVLLDAGMPVDLAGPDGMTLLGMAALANRVDMAKLLISRRADLNHVDSYGLTPLQIAASVDFGDSRMIDLLKKAGAKADTRDKGGLTALELARKHKHANLIASLEK